MASPMAIDTVELTQGYKRTANGSIKSASYDATKTLKGNPGAHSRTTSLDTNFSKIGEVLHERAPSNITRISDNISLALGKPQDSLVLRDGKGPEWLGTTFY